MSYKATRPCSLTIRIAHSSSAGPPLFSSLGDCLSYYRGDTVAYIGDDGYRTAKLDHLQETFTQVTVAAVRALQPYPGVPATLTIWKRTR